jgi:gas vesicle protein
MSNRSEMDGRSGVLNNGFLVGLVAGGAIGVGLALAFAPRLASELGQRATAAANDLSDAASQRYQDVSTQVAAVAAKGQAVVDGVTAKGQAVRDDVADAIGRGAREVEQFAMSSKTVPEPKRS